MVMTSSSKTGEIYASFMEEIKWRVAEIERRLVLIKKNQPHVDAIFEVEFCYLQLRFVCELIALASLVAHHSYGLKKTLLKEWHPDEIFNELEEINEYCFPWPVRVTRDAGGHLHIADATSRELTRSELKRIYGQCGNVLHRGMLKHSLAGKQKIYDGNQLVDWVMAVMALINEHSILFPQDHRAVLVSLHGGQNGEVAVIQMKADGPFQVQPHAPRYRPKEKAKPHRPRGGRR